MTLENNNYIHEHKHYNHTLFSYETNTPSQFTNTLTSYNKFTNTMVHYHHIYHIINIARQTKQTKINEEMKTAETLINLSKTNQTIKNPSRKPPSLKINTKLNSNSNIPLDYPPAPRNCDTQEILINNQYDLSCPIVDNRFKPIKKTQTYPAFSDIQNDKLLEGAYQYYFNDINLRNKIKRSHSHFSLVDMNKYLLNSWNNMNNDEKNPWITKQNEIPYYKYKRSPPIEIKWKPKDIRKDIDGLTLTKNKSLIDMRITKDSYTNNQLLNKTVKSLDPYDNKLGQIIGTYKRHGKQLRFRVQWDDVNGNKTLHYKRDILRMINE